MEPNCDGAVELLHRVATGRSASRAGRCQAGLDGRPALAGRLLVVASRAREVRGSLCGRCEAIVWSVVAEYLPSWTVAVSALPAVAGRAAG
ncbi:MAG: hypothetical protein ACJ71Y_19895 [Blastococcus sp.]